MTGMTSCTFLCDDVASKEVCSLRWVKYAVRTLVSSAPAFVWASLIETAPGPFLTDQVIFLPFYQTILPVNHKWNVKCNISQWWRKIRGRGSKIFSTCSFLLSLSLSLSLSQSQILSTKPLNPPWEGLSHRLRSLAYLHGERIQCYGDGSVLSKPGSNFWREWKQIK